MALKLFEFVEKFMMGTLLLKSTQFEKTGSIGKTFISLGKLILISISDHVITKVDKKAKKKISKTYIRVLTTFITLNKIAKLNITAIHSANLKKKNSLSTKKL